MARLAFVCLTILSAVAAVFAAPANTEGTLYKRNISVCTCKPCMQSKNNFANPILILAAYNYCIFLHACSQRNSYRLYIIIVFFSSGCVTLSAPIDGAVQTVHSVSRQLLAVFTCDEGYTAVGETILSCVDGEWDKIPPLCACKFVSTICAYLQRFP